MSNGSSSWRGIKLRPVIIEAVIRCERIVDLLPVNWTVFG